MQGYCVSACNTSVDCPLGELCIKTDQGTTCRPPELKQCHLNSNCPGPLVCGNDLQCRAQCAADVDCPLGQKCTSGDVRVCADPAIDVLVADKGVTGDASASGLPMVVDDTGV